MKYFVMRELYRSATADKYGIDNTPNSQVKANLEALVDKVLDPLREAYGRPLIVTSGYRCAKLNKVVGGASTSQHVGGQAADIKTTQSNAGNKVVFNLIRALKLPFDQLIWENGTDDGPDWVHVSYSKTQQRGQVLRKKKGGGYVAMA